VNLQAPTRAVSGIVIRTLMCPDELALVETVSKLQTLTLTFAPALNPLPVTSTIAPRTTVLGLTFSFPGHLVEPGG
jgi:hypothetical protein